VAPLEIVAIAVIASTATQLNARLWLARNARLAPVWPVAIRPHHSARPAIAARRELKQSGPAIGNVAPG